MLLFGLSTHCEDVPGGRTATRYCEGCHRETTFTEVRRRRSATVYFAPVANLESVRMMRCGRCGGGYALDEDDSFADRQAGSVAGWVANAATTAVEALAGPPESREERDDWARKHTNGLDGVFTTAAWNGTVREFAERLPDAELRHFVWEKRRSEHGGLVVRLDAIDSPTAEDVRCLNQIVDKLRRS
jgi:hypothetical protein